MKLEKIALYLLIPLFFCPSAYGTKVQFPKEELAKESVLPVFKGGNKAVLSRRVKTSKEIELGAGLGFIFNEPFFESMAFNFKAGYHLDSFHSLHLNFYMRQEELSGDAPKIDAAAPSPPAINFDVVPIPQYFASLDYQITPYYGKISLTKNGVMNMSLFGVAGLGAVDVGGATTVLGNIGFGANVYMTRRVALKADLRFFMYNAPNVVSNPVLTQGATSKVDPGEFEEEFQLSPTATIGLSILL